MPLQETQIRAGAVADWAETNLVGLFPNYPYPPVLKAWEAIFELVLDPKGSAGLSSLKPKDLPPKDREELIRTVMERFRILSNDPHFPQPLLNHSVFRTHFDLPSEH